MTTPSIRDQGEAEIDQILCDLHDLGFYGDSLAHLEKLAYYIAQERVKARKEAFDQVFAMAPKDTFQRWTQTMIADWFFRLGELERSVAVPSPQTPEPKEEK